MRWRGLCLRLDRRLDSLLTIAGLAYDPHFRQQQQPPTRPAGADGIMKRLIVARYKEDIRWLCHFSRMKDWEVHIYNDGEPIDPYYGSRMIHHRGDQIPTEISKFLQHIVDFYDELGSRDWLIFLQACPFDHSPDILGLLGSSELWEQPFQGFSFLAHPPPWGPSKRPNWTELFEKENAGKFCYGFRFWCDDMDLNLDGLSYRDPFIPHAQKQGWLQALPQWWGRQQVPFPIPRRLQKCYGSCFAVKPQVVRMYPKAFWIKLHQQVKSKEDGYQMELCWQPLFQAAWESMAGT